MPCLKKIRFIVCEAGSAALCYPLIFLLLCGCTSISTSQSETDGKTTKTTTLTIMSLFDSSAKVKSLRLTGTEKSQGVGLGEASTEANSELISRISAGATEGAIKAFNAKP